jgi:hypothetical protein
MNKVDNSTKTDQRGKTEKKKKHVFNLTLRNKYKPSLQSLMTFKM